jgi:23S rRNA-intervening sequence protein
MTQPAKTFKDLIVWQKAHEFVLGVYKFTEKFPKSELFDSLLSFAGQQSQLRRTSRKASKSAAKPRSCASLAFPRDLWRNAGII